ncbi:MAG: FtsX-like permease family protein [Chloroflexota bacterium]
MKTFPIWLYALRHKRQTALLLGLTALATMSLYLMHILMPAVFTHPFNTFSRHLDAFSLVLPAVDQEIDAATVMQLQAHPDIEYLLVGNGLPVDVPSLGVGEFRVPILGLMPADQEIVMASGNMRLVAGRPFSPNSNEVLLSTELARGLGLQIGDTFSRATHIDSYWDWVEPMEVVGLLESDFPIGFAPHAFLAEHEAYRDSVPIGLVVIPKAGRETAVSRHLETLATTASIEIETAERRNRQIRESNRNDWLLATPITIFVTLVITAVIANIDQIIMQRRLPEFGILLALGIPRATLIRRLTLEGVARMLVGWLSGLAMAFVLLATVRTTFFTPLGFEMGLTSPIALTLIGLIPLGGGLISWRTATRHLHTLDALEIIEQRGRQTAVSPYAPQSQQTPRKITPLSLKTFIQRHRQRTLLFSGSVMLLVVAVAMLLFAFSATFNAARVQNGDLRRMSGVFMLDDMPFPERLEQQLAANNAIERMMPSHQFQPMRASVPPFATYGVRTYALNAADLAYVVERYGLVLENGRLPRPDSNEMVISAALARNRNLVIGDVVGDPTRPIYSNAPELLTTFTISGIFAQSNIRADENWLAFASLEFIEQQPSFDRGLPIILLTAKPNQQEVLDSWLETAVSNDQVGAVTYGIVSDIANDETQTVFRSVALAQSGILLIAATLLGVLNYLFVSQRRAEFGILYAVGYGRWQQIGRALRETAVLVGMAWLISILLVLIVLLLLQYTFFTPIGTRLDLQNPVAWLFTLPIPLVIFITTLATTANFLHRLDPIEIINGR